MLDWNEILLRLFLACVFGASIGLERERKDWAAGIRTHMMVCLGSSLIMLVSAFGFSDILKMEKVMLDPSRIAAQVISGIGFIGAGTILFLKHGTIRGLTTASGLWTVAAIGLATGGGMYFAAALTTILSLIILWAIQPLEKIYSRRFKQKTLRIVADSDVDQGNLLRELMNEKELLTFSVHKNDHELVFEVKFERSDLTVLNEPINALKKVPSVKEILWTQ